MGETITVRYLDPRLTNEYWDKVREDSTTGCWMWEDRLSRTGTPMHGAKVAWRFAYDRLIEPLLKGAAGSRVCDNVTCVNPAHRVVKPPAQCPHCQQRMPPSRTRIEALKMRDGRVVLQRVSIDEDGGEEPEPDPQEARLPRFRMGERLPLGTPTGELLPEPPQEETHVTSEEPDRYKLPPREGFQKLKWDETGIKPPPPRKPRTPTGRWSADDKGVRWIELDGGSVWEHSQLNAAEKLAFRTLPGHQKTEVPHGTFAAEIEAAMDLDSD